MSALGSVALTSAAHMSKIIAGFILLKIIAIYLGAEGMGALGHFMSAVTMCYLLAGGGVLNAVIKYTAEYRERPRSLIRFLSVTKTFSLSFCLIFFIVSVGFSQLIAKLILKDHTLYWLVIVIAIAQFLFAFINIVIGVSNGLLKTSIYSKIQIFGSVTAIPLIWLLTSRFGFVGAALSIIVMYSTTFFPAFYYFKKSIFFRRLKLVKPNFLEFKKLSSYTIMLAASASSFPVVEIVIRQILISSNGYEGAGIWQGAIKLSSAYLGFFGVFLAYYFMPIISGESDRVKIATKTFKFMGLLMAIFILGATVFYIWRIAFISLILSESFAPLNDIILYQLIGDFFRVSSYVVGFVAVAKAASKTYIFAEFLQSGLFLLCTLLVLKYCSGAKGVMVGYAIAYVVYFLMSLLGFIMYINKKSSRGIPDVVLS